MNDTARAEARALLRRTEWLFRVRPMAFAELLLKVVAPKDRRRVLDTAAGVRMSVDPLSNLGRALTLNDDYEPDVVALFRREVKPGHVVVDIGANEGFYAALAGKLTGPTGRIVAVEPQSRLQELLAVNLALNDVAHATRVRAAIGEAAGEATLHLAPVLNHGASSLTRRSRFWFSTEQVEIMTADALFAANDVSVADLVKVDVEGHEDSVVRALLPLCRQGRVRALLLDYHAPILAQRGVKPETLHAGLLDAGMRSEGDVAFHSYALYRAARSAP